jgi:hypothetical protein
VNYQDSVNSRLDREDDIEAAPEAKDDDDKDAVSVDPSEKVQTAVQKVGHVILWLIPFISNDPTASKNCSVGAFKPSTFNADRIGLLK